MVQLLIILQFLVAVNSQYLVLPQFKPDITFDERNDRYDLTSFIRYQNQMLRDGSNNRRSNVGNLKRKGQWIVLNAEGQQGVLQNLKKTIQKELDEIGKLADDWRRSNRDIHPVDEEPKDDTNFEMSVDELGARRSLNDVFIKVGGGPRRIKDSASLNRRKETDLDYAVPIEMTINGYLTLP